MDAIVAERPAAEPIPLSGLTYDGRLGDLYRIFWRNLLLTVLTVGVFRFWAVTRNRRYLWSHTSFQGDRFEYTGMGGEKLRGFLIAVAVLGAFWALNMAVKFVSLPGFSPVRIGTGILYFGALLLLAQLAPFTAQRYRLSRTQWRALGGGMVGSALRYGLVALLFTLGTIATLFLLTPLQRMRLAERRIKASSFGDVRLEFVRAPGLAYSAFIGALFLKILLFTLFVAAVAVAVAVARDGAPLPAHSATSQPLPPAWSIAIGVLALLLVPGLNRICNSWYDAAVLHRVLARTRYLDLRFSARISGRDLFWLRLANFAIVLATLGLGAPIVRQRCARFVAERIVVTGAFDFARLRREATPRPSQGEGLFEAFDVGFLY